MFTTLLNSFYAKAEQANKKIKMLGKPFWHSTLTTHKARCCKQPPEGYHRKLVLAINFMFENHPTGIIFQEGNMKEPRKRQFTMPYTRCDWEKG